ncbi:MAG: DUF4304 domain-containing protein [Sphingomonas bacterium]
MAPAAYSITDGWRDYFAPVVRRAGFKGSGRHFSRLAGDFVQTISLQGSRSGGRFAVNLGLQPLAIPDAIGKIVDPTSIKEIDCQFRRRLSQNGADQWWDYAPTKESIAKATISAASLFEDAGLLLFGEQSGSEAPFLTITASQLADGVFSFSGFRASVPRIAQDLALLRLAGGDEAEAREFAMIAVERASRQWRMRPELEALLRIV